MDGLDSHFMDQDSQFLNFQEKFLFSVIGCIPSGIPIVIVMVEHSLLIVLIILLLKFGE